MGYSELIYALIGAASVGRVVRNWVKETQG